MIQDRSDLLISTPPSFPSSPQSMDMADATCIFSTAPLWTALMAVCIKKVREGGREGLAEKRDRMLRSHFTNYFLPSYPPSLPPPLRAPGPVSTPSPPSAAALVSSSSSSLAHSPPLPPSLPPPSLLGLRPPC